MVVMDAGNLLLLFRPNVGVPLDSSGNPVEKVQERLSYLVKCLEKEKTKIVIPTPALSELLVRAGAAGPPLVAQINKLAVFRIVPFDTLAAIETAAMTKDALDKGDKRSGIDAPWTKVKYDRQIVAIAKVTNATAIYSDDGHIVTLGRIAGLNVVGIAELPLPPAQAQGELALDQDAPESAASDELTDEEIDEIIASLEDGDKPKPDPIQPAG